MVLPKDTIIIIIVFIFSVHTIDVQKKRSSTKCNLRMEKTSGRSSYGIFGYYPLIVLSSLMLNVKKFFCNQENISHDL